MYWVVTDETGKAHLIEATSNAMALLAVSTSVSVRIAQQVDIDRYHEQIPHLRAKGEE